MTKNTDIKLLQLTDLHLQQTPELQHKGIKPEERFKQVMDCLLHEKADLLLLTGDLCHHSAPAGYNRLVQALKKLSFPSFWLAGNHDLKHEMQRFNAEGFNQKTIELSCWRIILLDSTSNPSPKGGGSLSAIELDFLKTELKKTADNQHILIALHHHPVSVQSAWQDAIGLGNADEFWQIIENFSQVKAVIFGHVHQAWKLTRGKIKLFSAPAVAAQFAANTQTSQIETLASLSGAGYAKYLLKENGNIEATVIRLSAE